MNDTERNQLHAAILQVLRAAGEMGRPADRLLTDLRFASYELSQPALETELRALVDEKRWVAAMPQAISATRYRITASGRSILEEANL